MSSSRDEHTVVCVGFPSLDADGAVDALRTDSAIAVETVQSVAEGCDRLDAGGVDCIVSDYQLPDGDGLSFLDTVREAHGSVPFVLAPSDGSETVAARAVRKGATDYVSRSAEDASTELRDRVDEAIEAVDTNQAGDYRAETSDLPMLRPSATDQPEFEALTTRYRLALDGTDTGIWEWDLDSGELIWDERAERLAGYDPGEFDGSYETFAERVHPDDLDAIETARAAAAETGSYEVEFRVMVDGTERWLHTRAEMFYHDDGTPDRLLGVGWDITERKRQQRELEELTTRLELALEETDTGVWECYLSTDEVVWDETCERLFGYDPGEFPGTYDAFARRVSDDDLESVERAVTRAVETDQQYQAEFSVDLPNGERRWVQSRGVVRYDDGEPDRLFGVQTDVTDRKQAEQAVEETKEYYRRLFEQSSDFVLVVDEDGTVEDVTQGVEHVIGHEPAELIGTDAFRYIHPDDRDRVASAMEQNIQHPKGTVDIEYRSQASDGSYRWLEAKGSNHLDDPLLDGLVANVRDISERKEREQELEALTTRLELALEETDTGVWEWDLDTDEIVWDEACEQLFGYEPGEFPGTYEEVARRLSDDDLAGFERAVSDAIDDDSKLQFDFSIELPDGETRWIETRGIVEYDAAGDAERLLGIKTDITDRKEAERAVEETKEYYRRLFEQSMDYVTVVDEDGTIVDVTGGVTHVLGYDPDEMIGTDSFSYIHPDDRERIGSELATAVDHPKTDIEIEYRVRTTDGSYRWMEARGNNQLDDPFLDGIVVYVRDTTQQKERQQELAMKTERLQRKNEQLERLARIVSHDLQTPLSTAEKLTGLLRSDLTDPDPAIEQSLADLEATHQRLRAFADHLPRLARESTDIEASTKCDLRSVAEAAWDVVDTGQLDLNIESTRLLDGDPERLQRLFENCFQNTVTHGVDAVDGDRSSERATTVRVGTVDDGFYIADDGPGIRPEQRDELFEYGMSTGSGSGFGLAIVRTIAGAHGWTISVTDSESGGARLEVETTQ